MPIDENEVSNCDRFRNEPILAIPASPTISANKRCIKREIINRAPITVALSDVILSKRLPRMNFGSFKYL